MNKKPPELPPIKSKILSQRTDYPFIRANAMEALHALGHEEIALAILEWENKVDDMLGASYNTTHERRVKAFMGRLSVSVPLHYLKITDDQKSQYQRELRNIFEFRLFLELSESILHEKNTIDDIQIALSPKPLKIGAESYLCFNLLITPAQVFWTGFSRYRCCTIISDLDADANSELVINALREHGIPLNEINYIDPGLDIDIPRDVEQSSLALRALKMETDISAETVRQLTIDHLSFVFYAAIECGNEDMKNLVRFIGGSYIEGEKLLKAQIQQNARGFAEIFLSLFPRHSLTFLNRMILRRKVSKFILNQQSSAKCPSSLFRRTDINFDILAKALPYLLYTRGPEALLNIESGDEYSAIPTLRAKQISQDLGKSVRWEKCKIQPEQVLDVLYPDGSLDSQSSQSESLHYNTLMLIPPGLKVSAFEAKLLVTIAGELSARFDALWEQYAPGDYQDRIQRHAVIRANLGKAGRLLLEKIRRSSDKFENLTWINQSSPLISEILDVVDYLNETFLRPNKKSNSQASIKFLSYDEAKKASDRWHVELYRSSFEDEDLSYFPPQKEIDTDVIHARFINTRRDLHLTGQMFKNCVYSKHTDILEGKLHILAGSLKTKTLDFVCSIEFNSDGSFKITQIRGHCNSSIETEDQQLVKIELENAGLERPKSLINKNESIESFRQPGLSLIDNLIDAELKEHQPCLFPNPLRSELQRLIDGTPLNNLPPP